MIQSCIFYKTEQERVFDTHFQNEEFHEKNSCTRPREREREREISFGKNEEYKKAKSFIWMF